MKKSNEIAYKKLSTMVSYNRDTGDFFWLERAGADRKTIVFNKRYAGKKCISMDSKGYIFFCVKIEGKQFNILAHRLAWFIANGSIPDDEIDHLNGIRDDNRISNLRCVSRSVNMRNARMPSNNKSGFIGVSFVKQTGKWRAKATGDGKRIHLGYFTSIDEAVAVVKAFRSANDYTDRHGA